MARRIEEGDGAAVYLDGIRADVLRDAAGLAGDDVGMADTDAERLREALGKIYGPVDVLRHGGTFLMTRGDAE